MRCGRLGALACTALIAVLIAGCGGDEVPTKVSGQAAGAGSSREAAILLQDAMLAANRALDSVTPSRKSVSRTALELRSASTQTSDAIALLSGSSADAARLRDAARSQRDFLEAMLAAAGARTRTDVRTALEGARSAGQSAASAYVEISRTSSGLAGAVPDPSSFGIAEMRTATAAVGRKASSKASEPATSASAPTSPPAASAGTTEADPLTFHAGTGNVTCRIENGGAYCAVTSVGKTFVLPASDTAFEEAGLRLPRGDGQRVPYGNDVSSGGVTCNVPPESAPRGITCTSSRSSHGFEASGQPARQKVY
jgi:regulator of extracellular matrix RemA (YlzA/DUF370 family)